MFTTYSSRDENPVRAALPTSRQLLRSTVIAAGAAVALLFTIVLPAEYGIDPTGLGALTGFVEVGERKVPLEQMVERTDEMSVTLKPGHAAEVKLRMKKGAKATYSWSVEGGTVSFNSHGEGPGDAFKRYERGQHAKGGEGVIEAAFYGHHGWYWRNPNKVDVTVTVRTKGNYADIKLMK
ncbi:MAG: transmembrane anchor protein [Proteobacteria bacterium]|nr:transmembrane anchor protein [Pseudomonadota bacterium]